MLTLFEDRTDAAVPDFSHELHSYSRMWVAEQGSVTTVACGDGGAVVAVTGVGQSLRPNRIDGNFGRFWTVEGHATGIVPDQTIEAGWRTYPWTE